MKPSPVYWLLNLPCIFSGIRVRTLTQVRSVNLLGNKAVKQISYLSTLCADSAPEERCP